MTIFAVGQKGIMMDELISRQAAILQLSHNKCGNEEWDIAVQHDIETITQLPSSQPEKRTETHSCDCISREAAIDALDCINGTEEVLRSLPSAQPETSQVARDIATIIENEKDMRVIAQPEIIRCKDCKYFIKDHGWNCIEYMVCSISPIHKVIRQPDDFCSRAERRKK